MRYHVHLKNEVGADDSAAVDATDERAAEVLALHQHPTAVAAIDAYPAEWVPAATAEQGRAR